MATIEWKSEWDTGIPVLDEQHREMFNTCVEMIEAIRNDRYYDFSEVIPIIVSYVGTHFKTEESIMEEYQYPQMEEHKKIHADMYRRSRSLIGSTTLDEIVPNFLIEWLINHVDVEDRLLARYIQRKRKRDQFPPLQ